MNCLAFCKDGDKEHWWHLGTDALYGFLRVSQNRLIQSMKRATPNQQWMPQWVPSGGWKSLLSPRFPDATHNPSQDVTFSSNPCPWLFSISDRHIKMLSKWIFRGSKEMLAYCLIRSCFFSFMPCYTACWTRDRTYAPCIGKQSLNHWTGQRSPINKFDIHAPNHHSSLGPPSPQSTSCSQALGGGGRGKVDSHFHTPALILCCWRRLLRVPWTARRSNQSILKEISPEYSLEGLMLKLKLQYFGHLMWRTDSLEKTLMLGKSEGRRRRGWQRMRWLDGSTDSMDI